MSGATTIWLDGISRRELVGDGLAKLVRDATVVGVAADPTVLYEAVDQGSYDDRWNELAVSGATPEDVLRARVLEDTRAAADVLLPLQRSSGGRQGHVTVELPLSEDPVASARRAWSQVARPNVLVTVPASTAGLAAAADLLAEGIGVHVSPVFSPARYRTVAEALRPATDGTEVPAVVSVFVSPVDTEVDKMLWSVGSDESAALRGRAALANALLVHEAHEELAAQGGRLPTLAWAGTGVRDPYYGDSHYLDGLPAAPAIRRIPASLLEQLDEATRAPVTGDAARATVAALAAVGVDLAAVVRSLDDRPHTRFTRAWQALSATIAPRLIR